MPPFAYEAYVRGELALAQGDANGAALQLELATAAPEEDAYLLSRLAEAQAQTGDRPLAERTLREAERVDACQQNVWLTRGGWAEQDNDLGLAEQAYTRARDCDENADRALLALHRVLLRKGQPERALALLLSARAPEGALPRSARAPEGALRPRAGGRSASRAKSLFAHTLSTSSVAETRFALDTWLSLGPPDREVLQAAVAAALADGPSLRQRSLALTLSELSLPGLDTATRAQLALVALDVSTARALLAQHHDGELGGPAQAARLARLAGDLERAELYASLALKLAPDDELRVLRAQALAALGEATQALEQLREVTDAERRRGLAQRELEALGLPALASELGTLATPPASKPAGEAR